MLKTLSQVLQSGPDASVSLEECKGPLKPQYLVWFLCEFDGTALGTKPLQSLFIDVLQTRAFFWTRKLTPARLPAFADS